MRSHNNYHGWEKAQETRVLQALSEQKFSRSVIVAEFREATKTLSKGPLDAHCCEAINVLGDLFCAVIRSRKIDLLSHREWSTSLKGEDALRRLQVGVRASEFMCAMRDAKGSEIASELAENIIQELFFFSNLSPTPNAPLEFATFLREAPKILSVVEDNYRAWSKTKCPDQHREDLRIPFRAGELITATTRLLIRSNMPAQLAQNLLVMITSMQRDEQRSALTERIILLSHLQPTASVVFSEPRLPAPLGRPAFIAAARAHLPPDEFDRKAFTEEFKFKLKTALPTSPHFWGQISERIKYLSRLTDPTARADRLHRYINYVVDCLAAQKFHQDEETYWRQLNLSKDPAPEYPLFYRDKYGVDNGPGTTGSAQAKEAYRDTSTCHQRIAVMRYSLNQLKAYTRAVEPGGAWPLEAIAEAAGGHSSRIRTSEINMFPGPGVVLSGIDLRNVIDTSPVALRSHVKNSPWLVTGLKALATTDLYFMRGFIAISRQLAATGNAASSGWTEGSIDGERYVAIVFNDHFHAQGPEKRMWLVPENVFNTKIELIRLYNIPLCDIDLTPEGLVEEAQRQKRPILSVGTSSVLFGGLANAWPHGDGPAHRWEKSSTWRDTRWQDPFHIHIGLATEDYSPVATPEMQSIFSVAFREHKRLLRVFQFFNDLHLSFCSVEERWAKGYLTANGGPVTLSPPLPPLKEPPRGIDETADPTTGDSIKQKGGDSSPTSPGRSGVGLPPMPPSLGVLASFFDLRNRVLQSGSPLKPEAFPELTLQYTEDFVSQPGTARITGGDMQLHIGLGSSIPLFPELAPAGKVIAEPVEIDERVKQLWREHFVLHFVPNNIPRMFLR